VQASRGGTGKLQVISGRLTLFGLLVATVVAWAVALAAPSSPRAAIKASAAGACNLSGKWESLGPTYVESLSVTGTTCGSGEKTITAYNTCRLHHGGLKGHCTSTVNGFRCSEKRSNGPVQFIAKTTCTKPRQKLVFTYSENT
jgi:hypothetical protein